MSKIIVLIALLISAGWWLPEGHEIPVVGASSTDWNPNSFWHSPWGRSGVHKGIDIFAKEGRPVVAASPGLVVYTGYNDIGGNVVLVLGAKWRFYYYAHLHDTVSHVGQWLATGEVLGRVGSTGNAQGKPPHLHFAIRSLLPLLGQYQADKPQALLTMFYVDPGVYLAGAGRIVTRLETSVKVGWADDRKPIMRLPSLMGFLSSAHPTLTLCRTELC